LGLMGENDTIPAAFRKPYLDSVDGFTPDFEAMLLAYYAARGWDLETGRPGLEKLSALGLSWVEF
jgi:aldehyde:ferredoxin oxidoreductase